MKGEVIPNGEFLYKYVKPQSLPDDQSEIPYGIFEDENLSCDWARLQKNPETSFHIVEGKNVIIKISVCDEIKNPCNPERPRQKQPAWEQKVIHDPIELGEDLSHPDIANHSHSLIQGKKKIHITKAIARNSEKYKIVDIQNPNYRATLPTHMAFPFALILVISVFILLLFLVIVLLLS